MAPPGRAKIGNLTICYQSGQHRHAPAVPPGSTARRRSGPRVRPSQRKPPRRDCGETSNDSRGRPSPGKATWPRREQPAVPWQMFTICDMAHTQDKNRHRRASHPTGAEIHRAGRSTATCRTTGHPPAPSGEPLKSPPKIRGRVTQYGQGQTFADLFPFSFSLWPNMA